MLPFDISPSLSGLIGAYPTALDLAKSAAEASDEDRQTIARLWLSEGIPFAFRDCPALYEVVRKWAATLLKVDPKDITVIGSARIGESLSPDQNFGRQFGEHSDLDLSVISAPLFDAYREAFDQWSSGYLAGLETPKNGREKKFWDDNLGRCQKNLSRGFIDSNRVPVKSKYRISKTPALVVERLTRKLRETPDAPKFTRASIRIYRDWSSFAKQIALSLDLLGRWNLRRQV